MEHAKREESKPWVNIMEIFKQYVLIVGLAQDDDLTQPARLVLSGTLTQGEKVLGVQLWNEIMQDGTVGLDVRINQRRYFFPQYGRATTHQGRHLGEGAISIVHGWLCDTQWDEEASRSLATRPKDS